MDFMDLAAKLGRPPPPTSQGPPPGTFFVDLSGLATVEARAKYSSQGLSEGVFRIYTPKLVGARDVALITRSMFERVERQVGLNLEIQLRDAGFDTAIHISTTADCDEVRRLLEPPEVKTRLLQLVTEGCHVHLGSGYVTWAVAASRFDEVDKERLGALADLAKLIPDMRPTATDGTQAPLIPWPIYATLAAVPLVFYGSITHPQVLTTTAPYTAFVAGLLPWSLVMVIAALDRRGGRSSALQVVPIAVILLVPFGLGTMRALLWANALWDTSAPRVVEVSTASVHYGYSTNDLAIEVANLEGQARTTLWIDTWSVLKPGSLRALRVTLREGRFGWTYVAGTEPLYDPPARGY